MATNIEMNVKQESNYEVIYPQTICDMVINLLNPDTKELMGLEPTADADDAFRKVYLAQVLDGRALINFTVMGDDGTPCAGVQIESSQFCDANGNKTTPVETDDEGKVSVFVDNISVQASISKYANLSDWSEIIEVEFGQQYDKEITLNRYNFRRYTSSGNLRFSPEVIRVDASLGGGGGSSGDNPSYSDNTALGSGGGGRSLIQEQITFNPNTNYAFSVGAGASPGNENNGNDGGDTTFNELTANGGSGCYNGMGGSGNGWGGSGANSSSGQAKVVGDAGDPGTTYIYTSFTEQSLYGGGGAGGSLIKNFSGRYDSGESIEGAKGGTPGGGNSEGFTINGSSITGLGDGTNGIDCLGGGGSAGGNYQANSRKRYTNPTKGGSGVLAIRMYRQQDLT